MCFLKVLIKQGKWRAGNEKKVKHLLELPNASTHLSLWKADLTAESSYDSAIQGCQGVFHVATPMELLYQGQDGVYVYTLLLPFEFKCQISELFYRLLL